ncbi:hypothetical protein FCM35_KLT05692 [Carex littledalei]|uniref:Uncharacterized protein n=1 Tax=Carex littledalei TaxID=544730 RepID=A0A833QSR5_9POAL|nr:hypothetical protein FCM35_KLT05692 [Carex littledalei]
MSKKELSLEDILKSCNKVDCHRCDWDCPKEEVFEGTYHCLATSLFHCCGKGCTPKMICDEYRVICIVSGCVFSLTQNEIEAVREFNRMELLEIKQELENMRQKWSDLEEKWAQKRSDLEEKWAQERSNLNEKW